MDRPRSAAAALSDEIRFDPATRSGSGVPCKRWPRPAASVGHDHVGLGHQRAEVQVADAPPEVVQVGRDDDAAAADGQLVEEGGG